MGIIKRQTVSNSIYTYLGVGLGFITSALIFPAILKEDEIGLLGILVSYSLIFAQFSSLGLNTLTIKIFPFFRNEENRHNGFLFIATVTAFAGFLLALIFIMLIKPLLINNINDESTLLSDYYYYLIPLTFFTLYFNVLDSYYRALMNAVIGTFSKELLQRVMIFVSIILFFYKLIDFRSFVLLYVISISMPSLILMVALILRGEFSLKPVRGFLTKDLRRHMIVVGFFGIISGFAGSIILNLDRIMVERFMGLGSTGIYTTTFYFATLVIMPYRALTKIAGPLTSEAWKAGNLKQLFEIYQKSCLHLYLAGMLILIGIWGNVDNIFRILPPQYEAGKYVILFIGLAYLFDMISGSAVQVLSNSAYFKYQTYFLILMILLIVGFNFILIPALGLTGAAISSALGKLFSNLFRYLFLYRKFKLQPYNFTFITITFIGILTYAAALVIPSFDNLYLDILVRSSAILLIFGTLTLMLKISEEVNNIWRSLVKKIR